MAITKTYEFAVKKAGLYQVGFDYKPKFFDWLSLLLNPFGENKLSFKIAAGDRFSLSSAYAPHVSLFSFSAEKKRVIIDLLPGETLSLEIRGEFDPTRVDFILSTPGSF